MNRKNLNSNWLTKNISKITYIFAYPISCFLYYFLFLWLIKKIPFVKNKIYPIWSIINTTVLSSPSILIMSFLLPMILVFVISNIFPSSTILAGMVAQIPIIVIIIAMPMVFVDFKASSILKRLFVSDIKKSTIIFSFLLYFIFLSLISILFIFGFSILLFNNKVATFYFEYKELAFQWKHVNWGGLFLGIFLNLFFVSCIGLIISSIAKTPMIAMAMGLIILIPGGFLTGQFFSLGLIANNPILNGLSYIFFQKYTTVIILCALDVNGSMFELNANGFSPNPMFTNQNWELVSNFSFNSLDLKDYLGIKSIDEFIQNPEKYLDKLRHIDVSKLINIKRVVVLTPFMLYFSIAFSIVMPIPIYILSIKHFKWSTR